MGKKIPPRTAKAYAEYLFMLKSCVGTPVSMNDFAIVDCRVRAFVDGVNWQKRQARKQSTSKGDQT